MRKPSLKIALAALALVGLLAGCVTAPEGPRHPNLVAAQELIENAIAKVQAAQRANEFDMGGHAARAKALLEQASEQIRLAAEAADRR